MKTPPKTEVEHVFFNIKRIKKTNRYFIGHWEVKCVPLFLSFLLNFVVILCFLVDIKPLLEKNSKLPTFVFLFLFLTEICVVTTIIVGPGYLPFYEGYKEFLPIDFLDKEPASCVAISDKQIRFAIRNKPYKRCVFIKSTGRYVIRANVIDEKTWSIIGEKNQKSYTLSCLYSSLFFLTIFYSCIEGMKHEQFIYGINFHIFRIFMLFCYSFIKFSLNLSFFLNEIHLGLFNITASDKQELDFSYTRSTMKNLEDTFGEWKFWCLPCPFTKHTNNEIDIL